MSDVSDILTARVKLRRLTSFVLDGITPSFATAFDRDVVKSSRMEVEVYGGSIPALGTVTIEGNGSASIDRYVVEDRVTGLPVAIEVTDGGISISDTNDTPSDEPTVQDTLVPGTYWTYFVSDGSLGIESTVVAGDQALIIKDQITLSNYRLAVSGGSPGVISQQSTTEVFVFTANSTKVGVLDFTSLSRISAVGIAGGSITVRAINNMGQPINQMRTVYEELPVRFYAQSGRIRMLKQGQDKIAKYKIMAEPEADIKDNDMLYMLQGCFGLTYGQIDFVEKFYDFDGVTHHTEAEIVDL